LKHNKFANKKEATLKIVLEAIAAFFLLNLYHIESRIYLVNNTKIFKTRLNLMAKEFLEPKMEWDFLELIIAKTPLFGYVITSIDNFRKNPWFLLNPETGRI
jgi:hypothetical protein